ncbi:MAG: inositol monophosphatase family protein [Bacteroidota bacterium]
MKLKELVEAVKTVALSTGSFIRAERKGFTYDKVEQKKGHSDLVSYVDKEAERRIINGLLPLVENAGFITEEETTDQGRKEYTWIIDPLDGTTNFVHGIPNYCVSIALLHEDKIILGVVYEIVNDECFYAWKDGGAFLNGLQIEVTPAQQLQEVILATGFPYYNFQKMEAYLKILDQCMRRTQGLRRVGSAAADMAYVACGRYGGFFEFNLNSYDIAAGIILVQEAGGIVSDFSGGNKFLFGREMVAGAAIHNDLLAIIAKFW